MLDGFQGLMHTHMSTDVTIDVKVKDTYRAPENIREGNEAV
jgi:hypothetical protein